MITKNIIILLVSILFLACTSNTQKPTTFIDYIPHDAHLIFKINDLEQTKSILRDQDFLKNNSSLTLLEYFKKLPVLQTIDQPEGLLCFSPVGKNQYEYIYIAKIDPALISKDSLGKKEIKTFHYANKTIFRIKDAGQPFFATQLDSILIASSSHLLIENAVRQQGKKRVIPKDLKKAYQISDNATAVSLFINGKKLRDISTILLPNNSLEGISNFSGWISTDATIHQNSISLDGIAIQKDSLSTSTIGIFNNSIALENQLAKVTPVVAKGFISYTYDDFDILKKNLSIAQDRDIADVPKEMDEILAGVSEIGIIYLENETAFAITSLEPENTAKMLNGTPTGEYRGVVMYAFESPKIFSDILKPLIPVIETNFYSVHDHQIVFTASKNGLQTIISNVVNTSVLQKQEFYTNSMQKLSDDASILIVSTVKNLKDVFADAVKKEDKKNWSEIKIEDYKVTAVQVIKENNYAHIHGIFQKNVAQGSATSVTQIAATSLDRKILTKPILVYNHRTKGMDIAVQDIDNTLYLISDKGAVFWKKQLNAAILGDIQQIDIFKNGRYQLLFATENDLYLLDRNGKEVAPYPIKFDKKITQPIALFDYDKNKRYRIVITQGNEIKMLDASGKDVSGFGFEGTKTNLTQSPIHIRIGSKDYILLNEENGTFNILDRLGRTRVKVKEKINFSTNPWYQYQNKFTSITNNGKLIQVASDGSILLEDQGLKEESKLAATNKTLVTFSENILTIKGKPIELEFGVYSDPKLFYIDNKIYISITDIQAHKVYLYDSNGDLFPNFPVYGNSSISLDNMDKDPNLEFVVQGEENSLLIYQIN